MVKLLQRGGLWSLVFWSFMVAGARCLGAIDNVVEELLADARLPTGLVPGLAFGYEGSDAGSTEKP